MISIEDVKYIMGQNLPDCWVPLEAVLSTVGAAMLEDVDHCIGLILVGAPGGRKSTTLELLGSEEPFVRLHKFTPASFVSHDATKKPEQLKNIDLLPKIRHKVMVIPELAPLFGQRYEDLTADLSILTAVMDGKGYSSSTGVHGIRGYEGDYRFSMIAATTPLEHKVWQALGRLSSRWIFFTLPPANGAFKSLNQDFVGSKNICRSIVTRFLTDFWQGFGSAQWDRSGDDELWGTLLSLSARITSMWRGLVPKQQYTGGYNPPVIEVTDRMRETLYAMARGHALLWRKTQIDQDDVSFAIDINYTNMPEDRLRVLRAFIEAYHRHVQNGGDDKTFFDVGISLRAAARAIRCSTERAKSVLEELIALGVIRKREPHDAEVTIKPDYQLYYRSV